MTVDALKQEISHLSEPERKELIGWIEELEEQAWDREMERDFAPGGRASHLAAEVKADIAAGRTKPLEQFLAEANTKLQTSKTG